MGKLATFVEQEIRRICETNTWAISLATWVGRLPPREAEPYRNSLAQQEYVRNSVPAEDDEGQERLLSLFQKSVR